MNEAEKATFEPQHPTRSAGDAPASRPPRKRRPGPSRGRKIYLAFYGTCIVLGAGALFGSIAVQLWGPIGAHDGPRPHKHQVYCTGQLWSLRQELEEATVQDFAHGRRAFDLTRTEAARRRTWRDRLDAVAERCQDLPVQAACAMQLGELEARYGRVVDEMHVVRQTLAVDLDATLEGLK